eukprot:4905-Chlamydomonas_euryale.AAC.1
MHASTCRKPALGGEAWAGSHTRADTPGREAAPGQAATPAQPHLGGRPHLGRQPHPRRHTWGSSPAAAPGQPLPCRTC